LIEAVVHWSPQTTAYARQEGVRVWVDGSLLDA